jgi:hypothetical protein
MRGVHATFDTGHRISIVNVSTTGMLIVSPVPVVPGAVHDFTFRFGPSQEIELFALITRVAPLDAVDRQSYSVGLKFLSGRGIEQAALVDVVIRACSGKEI